MDPRELKEKLEIMWEENCHDSCEFANGWCAAVDELLTWLEEVEE